MPSKLTPAEVLRLTRAAFNTVCTWERIEGWAQHIVSYRPGCCGPDSHFYTRPVHCYLCGKPTVLLRG